MTTTVQAPPKTLTTYEQIFELASPLINHYRNDLEKHDREWLEANPGLPFLHQTRDTGTHIIGLYTLDMLPGPGQYVPYLFSTANADRVAHGIQLMAECIVEPSALASLLLLHFDGRKLRKVSREQFLEIAREHTRKLRDQIRARGDWRL